MKKIVSIVALSLLSIVSCNKETPKQKEQISKKVEQIEDLPIASDDSFPCPLMELPMKTYLQPYGDFTKKEAEYIKKGLEKVYHSEVYINEPKEFPKNSFNGRRYRADVILKSLKTGFKEEKCYKSVIVGLTHKDISTTYKGHQDWGIIGYATIGGVSCVTSTYRLQNREQHLLATIHEIGHNVGLPHCDEEGCIMQDAKGKNMFTKHREFSKSCAEKAYMNNVFLLKDGYIQNF